MTDGRRPTSRKFRMIMGALALVAVVSGGAAYAATQDSSPQQRSQAIVNDAAGTLGVDPSKLSAALKKALENQVNAEVTAGKLTQAQADAINKRIEDGTQPIFGFGGFGGPGGPGGGPGGHFGRRGFGAGPAFGFGFGFGGAGLMGSINDVAGYLGVTPAVLLGDLRSGQSLADVAKAQSKTVAGLESTITTSVTKQLDAAVAAKKLSQDQETKLLAGLAKNLDNLVNGAHKAPAAPVRRGPGFGFGFGFGPAGLMGSVNDVAGYLGVTPAVLLGDLRSGQSLADVAKAQSKTVAGLESTITTSVTKQLDAAVAAKKLSQDQETKLLAGLAKNLDNLVNGKFHGFGFGHRGWKGPGHKNGSSTPPAPAPASPASA
jgi:hypothetical protein